MANRVDERTRALVEPSTRQVLAAHTEPTEDMRNERRRATFSVDELTAFMNGGEGPEILGPNAPGPQRPLFSTGRDKLRRKRELSELLQMQPWADKSRRYFWTREEEYVNCLKAAFGIRELMKSHNLSLEDGLVLRQLTDLPGGLELHIGMFMPTIMGQVRGFATPWCEPQQEEMRGPNRSPPPSAASGHPRAAGQVDEGL